MLHNIIKMSEFTSRERVTIIKQIRAIAFRRCLLDLVNQADVALAHDRKSCHLDDQWLKHQVARMSGPKLTRIDENTVLMLTHMRDATRTDLDLTFADVKAVRARGQNLLDHLLAAIMSEFCDTNDPAHVDALNEFLQPLFRETELARARRACVSLPVVAVLPHSSWPRCLDATAGRSAVGAS